MRGVREPGDRVIPTTYIEGDYPTRSRPAPVYAPGFVATYRLRRDRDWLTSEEADELRQLLADYLAVKDVLSWKVSHALNLSEDAVPMQFLQRALPLLATALEDLIEIQVRVLGAEFGLERGDVLTD